MGTKVTLGGVPLSLGSGHVWSISYGVSPHQRTFVMTRSRAQSILDAGNPISLVIEADDYPRLEVKNLYALMASPVDENNMGVLVADVRWKLTRRTVTRDYNVRRRVGDYRRVGDALRKIQVQRIISDVRYRRSSLKDGIPWKAREILVDILEELFGVGSASVEGTKFAQTIEGLVLDRDRGDSALSRVLGKIPGSRLYIDLEGKPRVVFNLDGSEKAALKVAGPRYRNLPGQVEFIDRSRIRPREVHVLFEPEPEIRFDYDEDQAPNLQSTSGKPSRSIDNVIPVVDPVITYTTSAGEEHTVVEGTWITVDEWIRSINSKAAGLAFGEAGSLPKGLPQLSMDVLRSHILSGFQHMRNVYTFGQLGIPDPLWSRRFSALQAHFRRTFRVNPKWMDLLRSISATRSSIFDQEHRTRAKASVYADHFMKPSRRTLNKQFRTGDVSLGRNVTSYAADLTNAKPAPVDVSIIDAQAGIFRTVWRPDPWGDDVSVFPGTLDEKSIAGVAMSDPALLDSAKIKANPGWQLAVVLSVRTASPNNSNRLLRVKVPTADSYAQLGLPVPSASDGPVWSLALGSGVETARFAWLDAEADNIQNAVFQLPYVPSADGSAPVVSSSWEEIKDKLLTNREVIDALAKAVAANVHALLVDRFEGDQLVRFNPALVPTGSLAQVSHMILGNGMVATQMNLPPILQAPDIYSLLPDSVRKIVQGLVVE